MSQTYDRRDDEAIWTDAEKMATIKILIGRRYRKMKVPASKAEGFVQRIVQAGLTEHRTSKKGVKTDVYHPPHMIRRAVIVL
jgi:hypothetical protein